MAEGTVALWRQARHAPLSSGFPGIGGSVLAGHEAHHTVTPSGLDFCVALDLRP